MYSEGVFSQKLSGEDEIKLLRSFFSWSPRAMTLLRRGSLAFFADSRVAGKQAFRRHDCQQKDAAFLRRLAMSLHCAERTRFELVIRLPVCRFSKPVDSATLPPLREDSASSVGTANIQLFSYFTTSFTLKPLTTSSGTSPWQSSSLNVISTVLISPESSAK